MTYKMKGFSGFKSSPAKQEGPIDRKNLKRQKGEMKGTYIFGRNYGDEGTKKGEGFNPTGTKKEKFTANERIIDYEDRASFVAEDLDDDRLTKKQRKTKQKTKKNLQREADIMRKRKENLKKGKKKK